MLEQSAIAPGDHGAGIPEQGLHSVAVRRRLPFVPTEVADMKDDLCDFQLGCTGTEAVKGLQHTAQSSSPLAGQPRVRRNGPTVQRGEQPVNRLEPIDASRTKRYRSDKFHCLERSARAQNLDAAAVSKIVQAVNAVAVDMPIAVSNGRRIAAAKHNRCWRQDDNAGVLSGEPENGSRRKIKRWINREIATPNAVGCHPSAHGGRYPC